MKRLIKLCILLAVLASCNDNHTNIHVEQDSLLGQISNYENIASTDHQRIVLANGQVVYMDSDSTYFLGDIVFSKEQIEIMNTPQPRGVARKSWIHYWPNKVIKYCVWGDFTVDQTNSIMQALSTISSVTGITFRPAGPTSYPCIIFTPSNENESLIGMQTNGNHIRLCLSDTNHTYNKTTVMHETMHSLGYLHEQARSDRDNYVVIHWNNIEEGKENNFETFVDWGWQGYNLGEFDYNSIMIYSSHFFNGDSNSYTMTKLDGSIITQGTTLSNGDIAALNFIYGPKPILTTTRTSYDNNSDASSIDETSTYSNIVRFVNANNESISLTYPRLLIVRHYRATQTGDDPNNLNVVDEIEYRIASAGISAYRLPSTTRIRQEDLGINRYYQDEFYSVYVY